MTAVLIRLTGMLLAIFVVMIGGAQALPGPQPDITAFDGLFSAAQNCEIPCLLGVQPGMPLAEAIQQLQSHEWATAVTEPNTFQAEVFVAWNWSGRQPDYINARVPGLLLARSYTDDMGHSVVRVTIETTLRFYEVQQAFGTTTAGRVAYWPRYNSLTYEVGYYDPAALVRTTLRADMNCPLRLLHYFWYPRTQITQQEGPLLYDYVPPQDLPFLCRGQ